MDKNKYRRRYYKFLFTELGRGEEKKRAIYLLGKPGRHEWHLKRIAVRMKGVERIRADGAQHGEHPSAELTANCNK